MYAYLRKRDAAVFLRFFFFLKMNMTQHIKTGFYILKFSCLTVYLFSHCEYNKKNIIIYIEYMCIV
jgi:hypothetical protein